MKRRCIETFEKCSILVKVKPPARRAYAPEGKTKILTTPVPSSGATGQAQRLGKRGRFAKVSY